MATNSKIKRAYKTYANGTLLILGHIDGFKKLSELPTKMKFERNYLNEINGFKPLK